MDPNGHEKRIGQLFREMRREDETRTPSLEGVLTSTRASAPLSIWSLVVAGGLATLVFVVAFALLAYGRGSQQVSAPDERAVAAPPADEVPRAQDLVLAAPPKVDEVPRVAASVEKQPISKPATEPGRRRPRRTPDRLTLAVRALSAWQSPTASLMKFPGEDMLNSLPRLDESLETIKSFSTDQLN